MKSFQTHEVPPVFVFLQNDSKKFLKLSQNVYSSESKMENSTKWKIQSLKDSIQIYSENNELLTLDNVDVWSFSRSLQKPHKLKIYSKNGILSCENGKLKLSDKEHLWSLRIAESNISSPQTQGFEILFNFSKKESFTAQAVSFWGLLKMNFGTTGHCITGMNTIHLIAQFALKINKKW
jgi:hypothetical protein